MNDIDKNQLKWRVHPLIDESYLKSFALLGCLVLFPILFYYVLAPFYCALTFIFLFISFRKYLFPVTIILDDSGIYLNYSIIEVHKSWNYYLRCCKLDSGIFLSPQKVPSRLDNFRGLYIKFSPTIDRDEVWKFIKKQMDS